MACLITAGLTKESCQYLIGGVSNFYLANKQDVINFVDSNSDGIYDSVVMGTSGTNKFYKFETSKNTSNFTSTLVVSGNNKYWSHTADVFVPRNDQDALDLIDKIGLGTFVVIVETRMGKKYILGMTNGMEATVAELNSGVAEGDSAGVHYTLVGAELGTIAQYTGTIPV